MHRRADPRNAIAASSDKAAFLALLGGNVALAFGPWFVRMADVGPIASGFWRIALAASILLALAGWSGGRGALLSARGLGLTLALSGIAFAGDLGAWHLGILETHLANATLLGNSATFLFPLYGFVVARAWPTRTQGLALALAAAGAGLLMGRSYQLDPSHLVGDLLCLLAGVLYAVYFILMARARARMDPLPALAWSTVAATLPLLIFALALGEKVWPQAWGPLIALAILSQVVGQGLMTVAVGRLSPLVIGLTLLTQPVIAAAIGWIVYGERLGVADLAGAIMVAVALVLVRRAPEPARTMA